MPAISPACLQAFVLAAGICLTAAFVLTKSKTATDIPAKMLLACLQKKEQMHGAAQAQKEVAPQPSGHLTTRRQMPIGRGYVSSSHLLLELLSLHSFSPAHV